MRFGGDTYLLHSEEIPDYETERVLFVVKVVLCFVMWILIIPFYLATKKDVPTVNDGGSSTKNGTAKSQNDNQGNSAIILSKQKPSTSETAKRSKKNKNKVAIIKSQQLLAEDKEGGSQNRKTNPNTETVTELNTFVDFICFACCILHVFVLFLISAPDNYYTTRTVFELPLFTTDECIELIERAERAAKTNYEQAKIFGDATNNKTIAGYFEEPFGWQKYRHASHRTTDLHLVQDLFTNEDRTYLQKRLDARLSPSIEKLYGVKPAAVRATDFFIVRYDGDRQAALSRHTDDGTITVSVLLNDDFEGGGTRYWNRVGGDTFENKAMPFARSLPKVGTMQLFPSQLQHEGTQISTGRRYLLIGFLAVERIDPGTQQRTELSWFASWGNWNWLTVTLKQGVKAVYREREKRVEDRNEGWLYTQEAGQIFGLLSVLVTRIGDVMYDHRVAVVVDETHSNTYLHALDQAYSTSDSYEMKSKWFTKQ